MSGIYTRTTIYMFEFAEISTVTLIDIPFFRISGKKAIIKQKKRKKESGFNITVWFIGANKRSFTNIPYADETHLSKKNFFLSK
jgi:hypothetical protein